MGVPHYYHPFLDGIFPYKPSSYWGSPFMDTPKWRLGDGTVVAVDVDPDSRRR